LYFFLTFVPIYRWQAGTEKLTNSNLPADKQYLVTKGVPCEKRIKDLQRFQEEHADELEKDLEDGWVETANPEKNKNNNEEMMDIDNLDGNEKMQVINN
jgi:hypothetical protein